MERISGPRPGCFSLLHLWGDLRISPHIWRLLLLRWRVRDVWHVRRVLGRDVRLDRRLLLAALRRRWLERLGVARALDRLCEVLLLEDFVLVQLLLLVFLARHLLEARHVERARHRCVGHTRL